MERAQYSGWFTENIYPLATAYAARNPVDGVEREDYVQELVAMAWEKVEAFDPLKSTLVTFAYMWFRNVRFRLMDKVQNRAKYISFADVEDSDGNARNVCDNAVSYDDVAGEESVLDALGSVSAITSLLYQGHTIASAAQACGISPSRASAMLKSDMEIIKKAFGMGE